MTRSEWRYTGQGGWALTARPGVLGMDIKPQSFFFFPPVVLRKAIIIYSFTEVELIQDKLHIFKVYKLHTLYIHIYVDMCTYIYAFT